MSLCPLGGAETYSSEIPCPELPLESVSSNRPALSLQALQSSHLPLCAGAISLLCGLFAQAQGLPNAPTPQLSAVTLQQPGTACRLAGSVFSDDGAMISGAEIQLSSTTRVLQATTDPSGNFGFAGLAPGSYTVRVTFPGFTPFQQDVDLQSGQTLDLPPVRLSLASVSITVDAVTEEQLALEQLHLEEHQRLVGVLPNFFVSYNWTAPPMTAGQKFRLATKNVLDPGNLALVGTVAGVQQAANAFPGYGQGAVGYGSRYGADLGNLVVGTYMGGAVLPALFHQDPRYFFKGTGTKRSRALYAMTRPFVTRGDNGHTQPNFAGALGDLSAGAISNLYYPASDRQGAKLFLENGILGLAGDAMNDLIQEFVLPRFTTRGKDKKTKP